MIDVSALVGGFGVGITVGGAIFYRELRRLKSPGEHLIAKIVEAYKMGLAVGMGREVTGGVTQAPRELWNQLRGRVQSMRPTPKHTPEAKLPTPEILFETGSMDAMVGGSMATFESYTPTAADIAADEAARSEAEAAGFR